MEPALATTAERVMSRALLALAIGFGLLFVWLASQRVPYPFELEWMEGAMVDHADRVRAGLDIYTAPTTDHIAFLYTPLLYYLGALLTPLCGSGFMALRLCSALFAVGTAVLLWRLAVRSGGSNLLGAVAAGLFLAGQGYVRSWYDLARNDTTFLCFVLWTALLLRRGGWKAAALAGVTATLAFLGKQTALMWLPALGVGALLFDWRRALVYAASATLCVGTTLLCYHFATDGWFTFFVFEMPTGHGIQGTRELGFFTEDMAPMLPMVVGAVWLLRTLWRSSRRREMWFVASFGGGGVMTSYLSRLHAGGYDNVVMYGFAAGALLLALLPAVLTTTRGRLVAMSLLLLQFAFLVLDPRALYQSDRPALLYDPTALLPKAAHRAASEQLVEFLRQQPDDVLVPFHGQIATLAGKHAGLHAQALYDLWQLYRYHLEHKSSSPMSARAFGSLVDSFKHDLTTRRWSAIVLDSLRGSALENLVLTPLGNGAYRRARSPLEQLTGLQALIGMETGAAYVLEPVR